MAHPRCLLSQLWWMPGFQANPLCAQTPEGVHPRHVYTPTLPGCWVELEKPVAGRDPCAPIPSSDCPHHTRLGTPLWSGYSASAWLYGSEAETARRKGVAAATVSWRSGSGEEGGSQEVRRILPGHLPVTRASALGLSLGPLCWFCLSFKTSCPWSPPASGHRPLFFSVHTQTLGGLTWSPAPPHTTCPYSLAHIPVQPLHQSPWAEFQGPRALSNRRPR
ncbi:uncharacterized protein LOC117287124 [Fukomys damarensis]|uniref:uncharacterized protein LOC117287124 n=1 Tax=Fukomys damarensis TaxID=885580 RepID=UPI001454F345|nr:uncharacterized protein LOC117287124 [Fukomys damarensis]